MISLFFSISMEVVKVYDLTVAGMPDMLIMELTAKNAI